MNKKYVIGLLALSTVCFGAVNARAAESETPAAPAAESETPAPPAPAAPESETPAAPESETPAEAPKPEVAYPLTINFDRSSGGQSEVSHEFASGDETIGTQDINPNQNITIVGMTIGKKYFIGWSNVPQKDFEKDNSKIWFPSTKLSDVINENGSKPEKLYAIFIDTVAGAGLVNANNVEIDKNTTDSEFMPDADIKSKDNFGETTDTKKEKEIKIWYNPDTEKYYVNPSASFSMSKTVSVFTYLNGSATGSGAGILTNSNKTDTLNNKKPEMTFVDLHVNVGDKINVKDTINNLTFTSYNFMPLVVFDGDYNVLKTFDTNTFKDMKTPEYKFNLDTKGKKSFIIRTGIRAYVQPGIPATGEDLSKEMSLKTDDKEAFWIDKVTAKAIADANNQTEDNQPNKINVLSGSVNGAARAAGRQFGFGPVEPQTVRIRFVNPKLTFVNGDVNTTIIGTYGKTFEEREDKSVNLPAISKDGYTYSWNTKMDGTGTNFDPKKAIDNDATYYLIEKEIEKQNVAYEFVSSTENKELPKEVKDLLPEGTTVVKGENVTPTMPSSVKVEDNYGYWEFKGYKPENAVANEDVSFVGSWEYVETRTNAGTQTDPEKPNTTDAGTQTDAEKPNTTDSGTQTDAEKPNTTDSGTQTDAENPDKTDAGTQTDAENPDKTDAGTQTKPENPDKKDDGTQADSKKPDKKGEATKNNKVTSPKTSDNTKTLPLMLMGTAGLLVAGYSKKKIRK